MARSIGKEPKASIFKRLAHLKTIEPKDRVHWHVTPSIDSEHEARVHKNVARPFDENFEARAHKREAHLSNVTSKVHIHYEWRLKAIQV